MDADCWVSVGWEAGSLVPSEKNTLPSTFAILRQKTYNQQESNSFKTLDKEDSRCSFSVFDSPI